jgi:hypothetical protein
MIRQIEIEEGEARRTAALMSTALILALAIVGVLLMRGLTERAYKEASSQHYPFDRTRSTVW